MARIKAIRQVHNNNSTPTVNTTAKESKALSILTSNATLMRQELLKKLLDGNGRDIDSECGYPTVITPQDYRNMYDREGIAGRIVDVWPEESWASAPLVYETESPDTETEFEKVWEEVAKKHKVFHFLARADQLSGVGRFGILLIGIDDGLELSEPVEGVNAIGDGRTGKGSVSKKIIYLRPFDESVVTISEYDRDVTSPRFGLPKFYNINFSDESGNSFSQKVHWHRAVHFADMREMSEVYGTPRMKKSYNRLLDIRKILSGSGEMFWRGAFPGYSFEVNQDANGGQVELDKESLRNEMENYTNGLQRYMALTGVTAKSLEPQVADPTGHLTAQLEVIALTLAIPKRILFGSEQAELASTQDSKTWNKRLKRRQEEYVTPMVVRPFVDRLIALGVLPIVKEYYVSWPDVTAMSEKELAEVAKAWAEALARYVAGGVDQIVAPDEFLGIFAKLSVEEINQIKESLDSYLEEERALHEEEQADLLKEQQGQGGIEEPIEE